MKAMQVLQPAPIEKRPLILKEIDRPIAKESQVLLRVSVCGVCRTDLHIAEGDITKGNYPITPGHQVVGIVEGLGENCKRFQKGDRLGVAWLGHTCSECSFCKKGKENLCQRSLYTGYHLPGGYAEYIVADENYLYELPQSFSDEEAAPLLCAGIIGYRAYKRSRVEKGQKLGFIGFGSSAHITLQIAQYYKCKVYVATRNSHHQSLAKKMGAISVSDGSSPFKEKMDSIIIFAPAGELVPIALKSLISGGTCALAGIHMSEIPKMTYEECLFHEKNLCSVEANTREDGKELLDIVSAANIKPQVEICSLEKANEILFRLKQDSINGSAVIKIQ